MKGLSWVLLRGVLSVLVVPVVHGCASPPAPIEGTDPVDPFGRPRLPRAAAPPAGPTSLDRADVDAFLAQGPGWFIQRVAMEPAHLGDQFVGHRLVTFFDGDDRFASVDLRPGDVVLRVNDLRIGKPEQFMKAWEDMKVARRLVVEYVRGGSVRVLQWDIVDEGEIQPHIVSGDG